MSVRQEIRFGIAGNFRSNQPEDRPSLKLDWQRKLLSAFIRVHLFAKVKFSFINLALIQQC